MDSLAGESRRAGTDSAASAVAEALRRFAAFQSAVDATQRQEVQQIDEVLDEDLRTFVDHVGSLYQPAHVAPALPPQPPLQVRSAGPSQATLDGGSYDSHPADSRRFEEAQDSPPVAHSSFISFGSSPLTEVEDSPERVSKANAISSTNKRRFDVTDDGLRTPTSPGPLWAPAS